MGLLSLFGASPETQSRVQKGLLDFQMAFPELRRQKMEEEQQRMDMEMRKQQQAMQQQQFTQGQQDRQRSMDDDALVQRLYGMPVEGAMPQGQAGPGMPMQNAGVDPQTFLRQGGSVARLPSILGLNSAVTPKPFEPIVSKPGDIARGKDGGILWQNPEAAPKPEDVNKPFLRGPNGEIVPNQAYQEYASRIAKDGRSSVVVGTGKVGELETSYRKEFNSLPEVVRYKSAIPAFKAVEGAANRPGTQSEINLIYGLAKLYDPESVVREGEYDTIANSQSIPEWLKGQAQRLAGGGKLTPETKRQILIEARARKAALEDEYNGAQRTYEGIAKRQGLDPQNVFTPVGGYSTPGGGKPKSRLVQIDGGGSVSATLGEDGNYYVKRGGKTYRVEE